MSWHGVCVHATAFAYRDQVRYSGCYLGRCYLGRGYLGRCYLVHLEQLGWGWQLAFALVPALVVAHALALALAPVVALVVVLAYYPDFFAVFARHLARRLDLFVWILRANGVAVAKVVVGAERGKMRKK